MVLVNVTRVVLASCLLLGCLSGVGDRVQAQEGASLNSSNFKGEINGNNSPLSVAGSNCTVTISDVPVEMTVDGCNNELKVPGGCLSIKVNGSNNNIHLGVAKQIVLTGSNNTIRYGTTPNKKAPMVVNQGANNEVARISTVSGAKQTFKTPSSVGSDSVEIGAKGMQVKTTDGVEIDVRQGH